MSYTTKEKKKKYDKDYHKNHKEKISIYQKEYRKNHREEISAKKKEFRKNHKEEISTYQKKYRKNHKEELSIKKKKHYKNHRKEILVKRKEYRKNHKEEISTKHKEYKKERYKNNILFKLSNLLRSRLYKAIRNNCKTGSAIQDLGCSITYFKTYLEKQFLPGMSWNNWGIKENQWSIDHIIPLSSVDLTDRKQFLKVCHYTNLRPLWHIENIKKGKNIIILSSNGHQ